VGWNDAGATISTSYYAGGTVNGGSFSIIWGAVGNNAAM
jgi:hypothetical protein